MASLTNSAENSLAALIFNAVAWANVADNAASAPLTGLYVSLHNADPGEAGSQITNETAYTNYARVAVVRTSGGWAVSGSDPTQVVNVGAITFPQCGATGDTITHWGVGTSASGAGVLLASGPVGPVAGPYLGGVCTLASPGVWTLPGSSYAANDHVSFYHSPTETLPTGVTEGVVYYVGTASGINITLSTTANNANPVNTSSVGAGTAIKQTPLAVASLVTPVFAPSSLKLLFD